MKQRLLPWQWVFSIVFLCVLFTANAVLAQDAGIRGKVIDANTNAPLAGVTVKLLSKGSIVTTSGEGEFTLNAQKGDRLEISYVGYVTETVQVSSVAYLEIDLSTNASQLGEVVVTALGIRKEKKKLGYAIQDVKGEDLTVARETNVVNQLAGKVAGVTVVGSASGVGGSSRVTIRGERSVDLNKNQPLYVIDGVPVSNAITGASGRGNMEVDFGNGAGFINPDDIESMSVLKGPAASALYGSRAANGVILIKTKSGKKSKGIGVEINTNATFETALKLPEYQKVYGQGNGNGGDFAFVNGGGAGLTDGTDEGWGPCFSWSVVSAVQLAPYPQWSAH
jgi:Outer membrane cobalamin receptor protein